MKSIFFKQFVVLITLLIVVQYGYSQQKTRTSERPFNRELQKSKLQEQRNSLVRKMGNRDGIQNHQKPTTTSSVTPGKINDPVLVKPPVSQSNLPKKQTTSN